VKTKPNLCQHGLKICDQCIIIDDAAKRMSGIINGYIVFMPMWELRSKWLAIRLSDGGSDGTLYDSREDAINHQLDARFCAYTAFQSLMGGASPKDCAIWLEVHRQAYDANMRLHEPEAPQLIVSAGAYDWMNYRQRPGV
jgi:hypothetical protein